MTPCTRRIRLTERHRVTTRLRRCEASALLPYHPHVLDIRPAFGRSCYTFTAGGYVGFFDVPGLRVVIRPKLPWSAVSRLLAVEAPARRDDSPAAGFEARFADAVAVRLTDLIRERVHAGLLSGYTERQTSATYLRGRLDLPAELRDRTPGRTTLHVVEDQFGPHVIWNQLPKAAADHLLATASLSDPLRINLRKATAAFAGVSCSPAEKLRRFVPVYDARTVAYRPLVEWSRLILGGPPADSANDPLPVGLLFNLETLFERYVTDGLTRLLAPAPAWTVRPQHEFVLATAGGRSARFRPDIVVEAEGGPPSVWDVKWKEVVEGGPAADDLHQILAYAAVTGATRVGLVYPGRRHAVDHFTTPAGVRVHLVTLRVVGREDRLERSLRLFAALVKG